MKVSANYMIALFNLAIVKEKLCHFSEAVKIYQQIIHTNKYFIDANIRLAYVFFSRGNFNRAI
jgi:tetratricopeptide (TPR) repeat protein